MLFTFKKISYLLFILFLNQNLENSCGKEVDEPRHSPGAYRLEEKFSVQLEPALIREKISPFLAEGFPEKRAKELFAQALTGKIFSSELGLDMLSLSRLVCKTFPEPCEMEFYKSNRGTVDELYVERTIDFLAFHRESSSREKKELKRAYRDSKMFYNEVHFLEEGEDISPLIFSINTAKNRHSYKVLSSLLEPIKLAIFRPCGVLHIPHIPLSWIIDLINLSEASKKRLAKNPPAQTVTILRPNGLLTLYKVKMLPESKI